jgi:competence protein ComEC
MTRPLLPVLCGLISGILLEHYWSLAEQIGGHHVGSGVHLTLFVGYFTLLGIWYLCYRLNSSRLTMGVLLMLAVVTGMTRYVATNHVPVHHISRLVQDERVTIEGFLYKPPEIGIPLSPVESGRTRYLYVETTWLEQGVWRYRVCGKIRITLGDSLYPKAETKQFAYGDTIRTRIHLSIPKNYDDEGDFNYQEYLRRQGIYFVSFLPYDRYIIKLPEKQGNPLLAWIYTLRDRMIIFLDQYLARGHQNAAEAIQVTKAMALGTSRELSPRVKEIFRNSGLYHQLVVSGIHIGILVWVFHQIFQIVRIPLRYRSLILAIILPLYAGLTGFYFPVLRSVITALALYFAITWNRIADPLYGLAFSVGLILFMTPTALFDISFQLTIGATAGILLLIKFLKQFTFWERFSQLPYLIQSLPMTMLMTVGAMIGVSPLTIFYFQRFYPYSFVSNLLVLPVITLFLPLSVFTAFLSLVLPLKIVYPLLSATVILAKWLIALAGLFPKWDVVIPRPTPLMIMIYYIAVYCGLNFYRKKKECQIEI